MQRIDEKKRCFGSHNLMYAVYHDEEWGRPSHDDRYLFEMLILEGAQAGLNWETILKRREEYQKAFHHFDPHKVAAMTDQALEKLVLNGKIIKNRLKIFSTRLNAKIFVDIQKEFGSFNQYLWKFVHNKPIDNPWPSIHDIPATSEISETISKDLKKRGMKFVGSTIIYAYLQAVGVVNDHIEDCCARK